MRQISSKLKQWLIAHNQLLERLEEDGFVQTPDNAREGLADLTRTLVKKKRDVAYIQDDIIDSEIHDVPIRIYHPEPTKSLPVLVYFHGGGHMAGSIAVYDPICRRLALETNHVVVSVEYRLAPECPYPDGLKDAVSVMKNIWKPFRLRNIKVKKMLSIAGDSGGGAICATIAHFFQNDPYLEIKRQILIYPSLDYTLVFESVNLNGKGYLLHREKIEWFFDNYFQQSEDRRTASPLYMDITGSFPETFVVTAEFCPLRDEGIGYVEKLQRLGVSVEHYHMEDMVHAFLNLEELVKEECARVYQRVSTFLNQE